MLFYISTGTDPCIDKAIHMLLMHKFGTLNTLIPAQFPGYYIFMTGDRLSLIYTVWPCYTDIRVSIVLTKRKIIIHHILFSYDISLSL